MANIYDMTDTWNNGATTFTAIKMDVSDSASAANSLLLDLKVDGVTKASIDKAGNLTANFTLTSIDNVPIGATTPSTGAFTTLTASTADINGGAIDGTVIGGTTAAAGTFTTFTSTGIDDNATSTAITISASQNVGIGTSSTNISGGASGSTALTVSASTADDSDRNGLLELRGTRSSPDSIVSYIRTFNNSGATPITDIRSLRGSSDATGTLTFETSGSERARIDSSGTLITNHNIREKIYNLTGTDINPVNGAIQYKTLGANTTFTESLSDGDSVILRLSGGDTYAVTYPTMTWVTSAGNTAPTLGGSDVIVIWQESSVLYGAYVGSYA
jgi:hypothetical protein